MINSVYKIISKVLSKRIKDVISNIISTSQGAFVKDRQKLDEILIANECVEERKSKGGKRKPVIIPIGTSLNMLCVKKDLEPGGESGFQVAYLRSITRFS